MEIKTKSSVYGHCQYWEEDDKTINQYYSDHMHKVIRARRVSRAHYNHEISGHELIGKRFMMNGKECVVDSVYKQWLLGYYELVLYHTLYEVSSEVMCNEIINGKMYGWSHGTMIVKNISCHYPLIIEDIEHFEFY